MVRRYKAKMDLEEWEIKIAFSKRNTSYYAKATPQPDYLKADIKFNLYRMKDLTTLRKTILHELCHIWLSPFTYAVRALVDKKSKAALHLMEETLVTRFERWEAWHK